MFKILLILFSFILSPAFAQEESIATAASTELEEKELEVAVGIDETMKKATHN
jgi:hypothetical protein